MEPRPDLRGADLRIISFLGGANLNGADLFACNLRRATFGETVLSNVDLGGWKRLELVEHISPSPIDIRTLQRSGQPPLVFLRGVGLPDKLIEYLPSLLNEAIQFYSCFISYSTKDDDFAHRLHADRSPANGWRTR